MPVDILGTSWHQCRSMVHYSFTCTETRRLVRRTAQDGHLDSHTAPELWRTVDRGCRPTLYTNVDTVMDWACRPTIQILTQPPVSHGHRPGFEQQRQESVRQVVRATQTCLEAPNVPRVVSVTRTKQSSHNSDSSVFAVSHLLHHFGQCLQPKV